MMIKPILFNTEMVRAILEGRKMVTRRVVKGFIPENAEWGYTAFTPKGCISCRGIFDDGYGEKFLKKPYQVGDILYVRETWNGFPIRGEKTQYIYKADYSVEDKYGYWKPSIHMPKEAARIWLKVTDVRVELLQGITGEQCVLEGVEKEVLQEVGEEFVKGIFNDIWDSTIKKQDLDQYGWRANPWVWVIEFERCEKPEE